MTEQWLLSGENQDGVRIDAAYHGPDGQRVVRGITLPYTTEPRPGETTVQFSVRFADPKPEPVGYHADVEAWRRRVARADCDRSPCSCGMHRDRT